MGDLLVNQYYDELDAIANSICDDNDFHPQLEEGDHGYFWVSERQYTNAINQIITGTLWLDGVEYSFYVRNGDWNGWEWLELSEDSEVPEIKIEETQWSLAPSSSVFSEALANKNGSLLLKKWDALLLRNEVSEIAKKYAYDSHFSPGTVTEKHWRGKAAKFGFDIVEEDVALEMRKELTAEATNASS